jgi:hypothetical protein
MERAELGSLSSKWSDLAFGETGCVCNCEDIEIPLYRQLFDSSAMSSQAAACARDYIHQ